MGQLTWSWCFDVDVNERNWSPFGKEWVVFAWKGKRVRIVTEELHLPRLATQKCRFLKRHPVTSLETSCFLSVPVCVSAVVGYLGKCLGSDVPTVMFGDSFLFILAPANSFDVTVHSGDCRMCWTHTAFWIMPLTLNKDGQMDTSVCLPVCLCLDWLDE